MKLINNKYKEVINYLKTILKPLQINLLGKIKGNIFELMQNRQLEGWCWESTQTCALFFNDNDYIERGYLRLSKEQENYYHSWICFEFKNIEYVFDPCLNKILSKSMYYSRFTPRVENQVYAKEVKKFILQEIRNHNEPKNSWLWRFLDNETINDLKKQTIIEGTEKPNAPIFRGNVGYIINSENDDINETIAHFYW